MARRRVPAAFPSNGIVFLPPLPSVSGLPHLHLGESWSLLGSYSCGLSPGSQTLEPGGPGGGAVLPPPAPSWALPSFPLPSLWSGAQAWGPSPVWQGEGFSSERGQCPSAAWWSRGPHPQGSPPLPHPGCSGLGAGPGGWLRASAGGAPGPAWGIQC